MVAVSFIDCGNFVSNTKAGAVYRYHLLFIIVISNFFAILMQCLCIKLGSVTGLDLAENCRRHFPKKWNWALYICAELAIIATDLAGVVGTAIALNILFSIPLNYGVLLTVLDVVAILFLYNPEKSMRQVRLFEVMISVLVVGTIVCFVLELFSLSIPDKQPLFSGFLPSKKLLEDEAIYLGCAIMGATVMPHSLYLGSALVQPRLKEYDAQHGLLEDDDENTNENDESLQSKYKPSAQAIKFSLKYSYWELIICLFVVATFVNCAILIVAAAALYGTPEAEDADLISIYKLLSFYVSRGAGLIFVLSLLFSGQASGLVVTISGQVVSEGFIHWKFTPWVRRLVTRLISIVPCILVTYSSGSAGIGDILNASQVFLSLVLPVCSAPLIYFTCHKTIMKVRSGKFSANQANYGSNDNEEPLLFQKDIDYSNSTLLATLAVTAWVTVAILNMANIMFILKGLA
ncbi:putative divalent metal ion transporter [Saccharomycopsis crataegensis]|uniref:Divalent metal ion transporter n=1 Tax=Saccharomycopsis crataegensis TaxID=43959 RepID=A0AAV5QT60_9ASCO|nr:putative divalent metal ion transporter [Saccharomycopsis crataegensis]